MTNQEILGRIRRARSVEEIEELLEQGKSFENVTERTKSRWTRKAAKRREELEENQ